MKRSTLTMSLALLVATFMWGCQDQGSEPVGPDGPQFAKPIRVRPEYTVTLAGDISGGPKNTTPVRGEEIIVDDFTLDLTFFLDKVTCGLGVNLGASKTGTLVILAPAAGDRDDHTTLSLSFPHNGAKHHIVLRGTKPATWPPTATGTLMQSLNGEWAVTTQGKNHRDGCTGEGEVGNNPIAWTATVTRL